MAANSNSGGGVASAVAVSAVTQGLAKAVHLGLNIVSGLALIHYLGPQGYGDYLFVLSFLALFGLLSDFGLTRIAVREMARSEESQAEILGTVIFARLVLAVICCLLAQVVLFAIGTRPELRVAAAAGSLLFVSNALLAVVAVFQVRIAMQYEAFVMALGQAVETGLVLLLIWRQADVVQIVAVPGVAALFAAALAWLIARWRFQARLTVQFRRLPALLVSAAPVGLTLAISVLALKLDSVLLGVLRSSQEVGIYGAAYQPVEYLILAAAVLMNPMFPLLARWHQTEPVRFKYLYQRGDDVILSVFLPIPVALALVAEPLLLTVYPASFVDSVLPLKLLAVALVFMAVTAWQGYTLLAAGRQRVTLAYDAVALALSVLLNVALIPTLGYMGAVGAALAASMINMLLSLVAVTRFLGVSPDLTRLGGLIVACLIFGGSLWLLMLLGAPWFVALAVSGLLYPLSLLGCRFTNLEEIRSLLPRGGAPLKAASGAEG